MVLRDIRARMIVVEEVSDRDGRGFNVVLLSTVQDSVFAGSSCSVYRDDLVSCSEESEILSRRTTGTMLASNVVLRLGQPLSTPMSHFASAFLIRFRRESQRERYASGNRVSLLLISLLTVIIDLSLRLPV